MSGPGARASALRLVVYAIAALCAGCGEGDPPRPAHKTIKLTIEGRPEPIRVWRYQSPPGFPLSFSTYVPDDMIAPRTAGEAAIRFVAAFGGQVSPRAVFRLVALPANLDRTAAEAELAAAATRLGAGAKPGSVKRGSAGLAWALAHYDLAGQRLGFVALGRRHGQWFILSLAYPPPYADGMAPRVALILREWRWASGAPLLGEAQPRL